MVGGATLTKLIGTSAWYAPGAAGAAMVEAIVRDEKNYLPAALHWMANMDKKIFVLVCLL
jgi:malate dehydrogenase